MRVHPTSSSMHAGAPLKQSPHWKIVTGAAVAAALLLSACGASGGSDDADKKTTTTKAEAATTTTAADDDPTTTEASGDADAQARVDTVDLTVSDFADGWTAEPYVDDDEDSPLAACDPVFSDDTPLAKHNTDNFTIGSLDEGDGAQVGAVTAALPTADEADAAVEAFNDDDTVSCISDALAGVFESGGYTVDGSLADDDIDVGTDNSAGVSGEFTLTNPDGDSATATIAVLAFSTGDLVTIVNIISIGESLDPTTLQAPITTLAGLQGEA